MSLMEAFLEGLRLNVGAVSLCLDLGLIGGCSDDLFSSIVPLTIDVLGLLVITRILGQIDAGLIVFVHGNQTIQDSS